MFLKLQVQYRVKKCFPATAFLQFVMLFLIRRQITTAHLTLPYGARNGGRFGRTARYFRMEFEPSKRKLNLHLCNNS